MDRQVIRALAQFNQITFTIIGTFVVSYFIGKGLDYIFDTEFFIPIFLVMGVFASSRAIKSYGEKIAKDNKKDK